MKILIHATFITALLVSACDSGESTPEGEQTGEESNEAQATGGEGNEAQATGGEAQGGETEAQTPTEPEATYTPGAIGVRVLNLLAENVDLYVRTTGRVRAFLVQEGLAPNATSEFFFPPEGGNLVVTPAGAGDATCVVRCEHFIATARVSPPYGNAHTLILYDDDGRKASMDLWENPTPERQEGSANAMAVPDPARAVFVVNTTRALRDARFGLRLGFQGVEGCQMPTNSANPLVGGTQTPAFGHDPGPIQVLFYDSADQTCSGEAVGGPFTIEGAAGGRNHLVLHGAPGSMQAEVIPMSPVAGPQP